MFPVSESCGPVTPADDWQSHLLQVARGPKSPPRASFKTVISDSFVVNTSHVMLRHLVLSPDCRELSLDPSLAKTYQAHSLCPGASVLPADLPTYINWRIAMRIFGKLFLVLLAMLLAPVISGATSVSTSYICETNGCVTIQAGTLFDSYGGLLQLGFNEWGYNYQAHTFNGKYCDAYHDDTWCQPYREDDLLMKWNDAWLSNQDCDGDGELDRHLGFTSYIGSGAWLTNHQKGVYLDSKGKKQRWEYFVKIVAAPADATKTAGVWYAADGSEIGPDIWGEFAIIQQVENDTGTGTHGAQYVSPYSAGFGRFSPE